MAVPRCSRLARDFGCPELSAVHFVVQIGLEGIVKVTDSIDVFKWAH